MFIGQEPQYGGQNPATQRLLPINQKCKKSFIGPNFARLRVNRSIGQIMEKKESFGKKMCFA